jgi:cytoskeletal protein CcmA (bactofilin family)
MLSNNHLSTSEFKNLAFSLIGIENLLKGELHFKGHVILAGKIEGSVHFENSGTMVIERSGHLTGELFCDRVEIAGTFHGEIKALGAVIIYPGAVVVGKIKSKTLSIYPGASTEIEADTLE